MKTLWNILTLIVLTPIFVGMVLMWLLSLLLPVNQIAFEDLWGINRWMNKEIEELYNNGEELE